MTNVECGRNELTLTAQATDPSSADPLVQLRHSSFIRYWPTFPWSNHQGRGKLQQRSLRDVSPLKFSGSAKSRAISSVTKPKLLVQVEHRVVCCARDRFFGIPKGIITK